MAVELVMPTAPPETDATQLPVGVGDSVYEHDSCTVTGTVASVDTIIRCRRTGQTERAEGADCAPAVRRRALGERRRRRHAGRGDRRGVRRSAVGAGDVADRGRQSCDIDAGRHDLLRALGRLGRTRTHVDRHGLRESSADEGQAGGDRSEHPCATRERATRDARAESNVQVSGEAQAKEGGAQPVAAQRRGGDDWSAESPSRSAMRSPLKGMALPQRTIALRGRHDGRVAAHDRDGVANQIGETARLTLREPTEIQQQHPRGRWRRGQSRGGRTGSK